MLQNYLKTALRALWRTRGYTAINVLGLAVAFGISIFLLLTAYLQLTYDSFHKDGDRIYQTYLFANDPEGPIKVGSMPLPLTPALKADFPELEVTRVMVGRKSLVEVDGKFVDKLINFTDPDFLRIFSFPLLTGNRETVLRELSSVVISQNMARDVFGSANPVGRRLHIGNGGQQRAYIVTGVIANAPQNSSVRYDALVRMETAPDYATQKANWYANSHNVFLKVPASVSQAALEARLRPFSQKYFLNKLTELKQKKAQPDARGDVLTLRLQKLADVHFNRELADGKGTPIAIVYVLIGMTLFILAIAGINFINLSIARSFTRAREVGVRKALGALKGELLLQIGGESGLVCGLGFLLGWGLACLLIPAFNAQFNARLQLADTLNPGFVALAGGVLLLVTLIAGGYPAWQLAKVNAVETLKGKLAAGGRNKVRNGLIVSQFVLSCLLACCAIIAFQQTDHLRQSPLGFDKEQVISIPVGTQVDGRQALQRLRNKLAGDPRVLAITGAGLNLGRGKDRVSSRSTMGFTFNGRDISTDVLMVDYDYFKTLKIPVTAGRDFSRTYAADSANRIIVTQSMAKMMGVTNPVGTLLGDDSDSTVNKAQIIGVVPDFRLYSVGDKANPISIHLSGAEPIHYVFVRVAPQQLAGAMQRIQKAWAEVAPQSVFLGTFLDENVDAWYQNEAQLSQILSLATGVALILSCIGLFAIALLLIEQRTKEIGIRKVLGATTPGLVLLLSREFVRLVLIALAIAIPLAWFGMHTWLTNYAYRITISPWVFVGVGLSAIGIALLTVSYQSIRAALMNPVKSLRTE